MINERRKIFYTSLVLLDICAILAAFFVSYYIRSNFHYFYKLNLVPGTHVIGKISFGPDLYGAVCALSIAIWILTLWSVGFYTSFRTRSYLEETWLVMKAAFFTFLAFGSLSFLLKIEYISRLFLFMFIGTSAVFIFLERVIVVKLSHKLRRSGHNFRLIMVVGTGPRAKKFIGLIYKHMEWGFRIIGLLDADKERVGKKFFGVRCIGTIDEIEEILNKHVVDEVVIVVPRSWLNNVQNLISVCELRGIPANVAGDIFNVNIARASQRDLDGFPLITFETTWAREWELLVKRLVDIIVSALVLTVLSPLLLTICILIKITSPGPIFFRQKRVGLNGRHFYLHKFRSMRQDAQKELEKLKHLNEMDGPVFKIKHDPRITPIGKFLRKFSLDEFPQFYDVLVGNISIVGPRPPIPEEVKKYEPWQKRRLSMRPGITCLWQVMGRNKLSFQRWMELDLRYIDTWSLWLDFKIFMKTIPTVITGYGAQ